MSFWFGGIAESEAGNAAGDPVLSDSVSVTEAITTASAFASLVSETVALSESVVASVTALRTVSDTSEAVTDLTTRTATYAANNSSTSTVGDISLTLGSRLYRWFKDYTLGNWDDADGGGDATQGTGSLQPAVQNTTGGQSYPDFDGGDRLTSTQISALPTHSSAYHYIWGCLLRVDASGTQWVYGTDSTNQYVNGSGNLQIAGAISNSTVTDGVWRRVVVTKDGSSGTVTMYIDGVAQTTTSTQAFGSDWKTTTEQWFGDRPGGGFPLNGAMASMFWGHDASTAFSTTDVANLDADLAAVLSGGASSPGDSVTLTESLTASVTLGAVVVDAVDVSDAVSSTLTGAGNQVISDAIDLTDSHTREGGTPIAVFAIGVAVAEQELNAVSHGGSFTKTTPGTDVVVSSVDTGTNVITASAAHGMKKGDGPFRFTTTDTLPGGLSEGTDYYVIYDTTTTFKVATSGVNAVAGTAVDITSAGTGTHTMVRTVDTTDRASILLTFLARGSWSAAPADEPSDNKGNTYAILGSSHAYASYPSSATGVYYVVSGAGGTDHTWSMQGADFDEITISALEVKGGLLIQDHSHVERAIGSSTITSNSVTTTAPAILVAVAFGNGPVNQDHTFTPGSGWTKIPAASREADMSTNGYIQVSVAYKAVTDPGTYTVDWSGVSNEGAQLYLIAVQSSVGISDALSVTDANAAALTFGGSASDTVDVSETVNRVASYASSLGDTATLTEAATTTVTFGAGLADSITVGDDTGRSTTFGPSVQHAISVTESLTTTTTYSATISDAVVTAEAASASAHYGATVSDVETLTESVTRTVTFGAGTSDTATSSETTSTTASFARSNADAVDIASDTSYSLTGGQGYSSSLSDTVSVDDAVTTASAFVRTSAAAATTGDAVSVASAYGRTTLDAVDVSDALAHAASYHRLSADAESVGDDVSTTLTGTPQTYERTISDSATTDDVVGREAAYARTAADAEAIAEALLTSRVVSVSVSDTADAMDALGTASFFVRTGAFYAALADDVSADFGIPITVADIDTFLRRATGMVDTVARTTSLDAVVRKATNITDRIP